MFATIRRYDAIDQEHVAELAKKVDETLLPSLSELPGFNGYYLIDADNLDAALERAAASLGASPWRVFRRVTLPLLRPGLFAALLFALIVSSNEFVVSLFISTRVTEILPVAMFTYVVNYTDPTMAAVSVLFIAATFAVVVVADRALNLSRIFQIEEH